MTETKFDLEKIKELLQTRAENGGAESMNIVNYNEKSRVLLVQFKYKGNYTEFAVYDYTEDGFLDLSTESANLEYIMKQYQERIEG